MKNKKSYFREKRLVFKQGPERPEVKSEKLKDNQGNNDDGVFEKAFKGLNKILEKEVFSRAQEQTDLARREREDVYERNALPGRNNWEAIPKYIKADNQYLFVLSREIALLSDAHHQSIVQPQNGPFDPVQNARLEQLDKEKDELAKRIYANYLYLPKAFTGDFEEAIGRKNPYPGEEQTDEMKKLLNSLAKETDLAEKEFDRFLGKNSGKEIWSQQADEMKATTKYALVVAKELQAMNDLHSFTPEQKLRWPWLEKQHKNLAVRMGAIAHGAFRFFDNEKTDEALDKALKSLD